MARVSQTLSTPSHMALTEEQAQKVMLVRSLEQAWDNEGIWSASDAKEATRVTTDLLGANTAFDTFLARRAEWVVDRLVKRKSVRAIQLGRRPWLAMAGTLLVAGALAVGFQPLFLDFQTLGEEAAQKVLQSKLYEYA